MPSLAPGMENLPEASFSAEMPMGWASLQKRTLGVLMDTSLNMRQRYALTATKASPILGYISKTVTRRSWEMALPFYISLVKSHLGCCIQLSILHNKGIDIQEQGHCRLPI